MTCSLFIAPAPETAPGTAVADPDRYPRSGRAKAGLCGGRSMPLCWAQVLVFRVGDPDGSFCQSPSGNCHSLRLDGAQSLHVANVSLARLYLHVVLHVVVVAQHIPRNKQARVPSPTWQPLEPAAPNRHSGACLGRDKAFSCWGGWENTRRNAGRGLART